MTGSLRGEITGPLRQSFQQREYQAESFVAPALHATVAACYQGGSSS
jgi:hypothetical protein